ncbi:MAG: hypothetical protein H3C43_07785 [Leptonema sp. (in: Bacteria)]|nr:hypothetical protein [Leptonema sp. (in: bacteria)]
MDQILETIKKIGAGVIVIALILMMGITFSSQPMDEIISILSGGKQIGSFQGQQIRPEIYDYAAGNCENYYRQFGEIPKTFIDQCISGQVKSLMVIPAVALDMGLDVSEKRVHQDLIDQLREQVNLQNQSRLHDDRINLEEAYRQEISRFPMTLRLRLLRYEMFNSTIGGGAPFPVAKAELEESERVAGTTFDFDILTFTNTQLLSGLTADASLEEMKTLYEKDKREAELRAKKEKKEFEAYPTFEDRRGFLQERIVAEKKSKQLEDLKASFGNQRSGATLAQIAEKTGSRILRVQVPLLKLNEVKLPSGKTIQLTNDKFLQDLAVSKEGLKGPYQDGENTIYLQVNSVRLSPKPTKIDAELQENRSHQLVEAFSREIINDYSQRGNFRLRGQDLVKE